MLFQGELPSILWLAVEGSVFEVVWYILRSLYDSVNKISASACMQQGIW